MHKKLSISKADRELKIELFAISMRPEQYIQAKFEWLWTKGVPIPSMGSISEVPVENRRVQER